jgi:hypothetical protein
VSHTISVPGRFNGPLTSGHGGYCSGVIAWPIEADGRKCHAGAAVLSSGGAPLAVARALMIEAREEPPG